MISIPFVGAVIGNPRDIVKYTETSAERAISISPARKHFPPGDNRRYGTGLASIQDAVDVVEQQGGGFVDVVDGTYDFGTSSLTIPSLVNVRCAGRMSVTFTYSGTDAAIDMRGASMASISGFYLTTTDDAATGLRIGNASRRCVVTDFFIQGNQTASNTGTAIHLDADDPTGNRFSGGLFLGNYYLLGYKYGIRFTGVIIGSETWTTVTSVNGWIVGRGVGRIAGSRGIWMDSLTNGVGTVFLGGTIEAYDVAIQHDNGGFGLWYTGDIEGNNTPYVVGESFNGGINIHPAGEFYRAASNSTANLWMKELHKNGFWTTESFFDKLHVIYTGNSTAQLWGLKRGDSLIDGGSPADKFIVSTGGAADLGILRNFYQFLTHKITYSSIAPNVGTWTVGDICHNTAPSVDGNNMVLTGWICTVAGTPGTWVTQYVSTVSPAN